MLEALRGERTLQEITADQRAAPEQRIYPYLLRGLVIERADQIWCADITDIPAQRDFLYLVAIMDWARRDVLLGRLSSTLDALLYGRARRGPGPPWRGRSSTPTRAASSPASASPGDCRRPASASRWLAGVGSWTTFGRSLGSMAFAASTVERLWRSLEYETMYLHETADGLTACSLGRNWVVFYNAERP